MALMSRELLKALEQPIIAKLETCSIANLSDILFAYSNVALTENLKGLLEKSVQDKLELKENFNTWNSTKILWSLAKFQNFIIAPGFNQDVSAVILPRNDLPIARSIDHAVPKMLITQTIEQKKNSTPLNLSLSLFSMACVDFHDQAYYEQAMLNFKQSPPNMKELGLLS